MDWFVEVMSGEVNWYELVIFLPIYNLILRRYFKGPKGDKGDRGPMGMMGMKGLDGKDWRTNGETHKEAISQLEADFEILRESEAFKRWQEKRDNG